MLELPALMYKDVGSQPRAGGTYSYLLVSTPEDWVDGIASGWYETLPDAIVANALPAMDIDDVSPPTMDELKTKATELGIKFQPGITAKTLQKKIDDALADAAA